MQRIVPILLAVLFCANVAFSQDVIRFQNGRVIEVKILEVNGETVRYKKMSNLDGPDFSFPISKVSNVTYANGETVYFDGSAPLPSAEPIPAAEPEPSVEAPAFVETEPVAEPAAEPAAEPVAESVAEPAPEPEPVVEEPAEVNEVAAVEEEPEPAPVKKKKKGKAEEKGKAAKPSKKKERSRLDFSIQVGLNLLTNSSQGDIDFFSPSAFAELYLFPVKWLGLGAGVGFMYATSSDPEFGWINTYDDGATAGNSFLPVYGSFKFRFGRGTTVIPYAKLDLGYAFWWGTPEVSCPNDRPVYLWNAYGGFLKGIGAGIDFGFGLNVEASLLMFSGGIETKYKYNGYTYYRNVAVDWTFLNLSIGYTF